MRDRLIKLLTTDIECNKDGHGDCNICEYKYSDKECERHISEIIADFLLANGVIVLPCKVGDTVYVKWRLHRNSNYGIYPVKVYALRWDEKKNNFRVCVEGRFEISAYGGNYTHYYGATFSWNNVGKTVFLTREEAERALRGDLHQ